MATTLARELPGFLDHLTAENKAPRTIQSYGEAVRLLLAHLEALEDPPETWAAVTRGHVQGFLGAVLKAHSPSTAANRYRSLRQFFRYLEEEEVLVPSPMAKMSPPQVPEQHRRTLADEEVAALMKACGKDLEGRRDLAILSLLYDTGVRLAEVAGIALEDIDLEAKTALVLGKGGTWRTVAFEPETARDIRRYLRLRDAHKAAHLPNLWVGKRGAFGVSGVTAMLRRRVAEAGLPLKVTPHLFRHTAIDRMLGAGMSEGDVMRQVGHRTDTMIRKVYAQQTAAQRALEARRKVRLRGRFS